MSLVFAAIAPHGGIAVPEAVAPEVAAPAAAVTGAMLELGRRFDESRPETVVVLTPHNVHVDSHLAIVVAGRMAGSLPGARQEVRLDLECDRELASGCLAKLGAAGLPALGVSFGGNDPQTAVMPMDWAVLIPLWFIGGRAPAPPRLVVVSPARELDAAAHLRAGAAIGEAIRAAGGRVALLASADHGHAHREDGPYGYHPAAAVYDARILEILGAGDLQALAHLEPAFVESARADSWWQMLMLGGALGGLAGAEVLAYAAPTYFGMLCADLTPKPTRVL